MPASSINLYHMQDAKNNFNALQLAPVCSETDALMGQCQNYHVSTNCYYGFHSPKGIENTQDNNDSEMTDVDTKAINTSSTLSRHNNSRKRSAEDFEYPQTKRLREEGMVPPTSNYNPCLLRPTHNNPDITRCLMKYKQRNVENQRQLRNRYQTQVQKT